jgi:DNA-binding transcriptional regulator YhcF (GntR family)
MREMAATVKNTRIIARLRERIVDGRYLPSSRLPTCQQLEREFKASRMTVLKALDQLKRDEFIRTDGRRGTFVAERPPQLFRYAVVFSEHHLSRFSQALFQTTEVIQRETPRRLPSFFGVDGHTDVEDYGRLVADVRAQRLAGMICVAQPGPLAATPLFDDPTLPRVALVEEPDVAGVASVSMDSDSYIRLAVEKLAELGCRRVGVLSNAHRSVNWRARLETAIRRSGMETRRGWMLAADVRFPHWVLHSVAAIFDGNVHPDGFLIADDHLVEPATRGLLELGVPVPDDVRVLAHGNFPCLPASIVPVTWLGFHARTVLESACSVIDAWRQGGRRPAPVRVAAQIWDPEGDAGSVASAPVRRERP